MLRGEQKLLLIGRISLAGVDLSEYPSVAQKVEQNFWVMPWTQKLDLMIIVQNRGFSHELLKLGSK